MCCTVWSEHMYEKHLNKKAFTESLPSALIQHQSRHQNLCFAAEPSLSFLESQILKHAVWLPDASSI